MVFVRRDAVGEIVAVSRDTVAGFGEQVAANDRSLARFVNGLQESEETAAGEWLRSDRNLVRVLEDLIELLEEKSIIDLCELPEDARDKIAHRRELRRRLRESLM